MFIVGKKSDKSIVSVSPRYGQENPTKEIVLPNIVGSCGGAEDDYDVFYIDDSSEDCQRIIDQHSFELLWVDGKISAIDFSVEDNKKWLKIIIDKTVVAHDGVDSIAMTGKVLLSDKITLDKDYNDTILIPIKTPTLKMKLKATFTNGICNHTMFPEQYGGYLYPSTDRYVDDLRVVEQIKIDSVYEVLGV